jgi:L-alanine-DL-glutamate epimerase-like enolase superfamily enzyme
MPNKADIQITNANLTFLPIQTRVPLKFGSEVLSSVTCARVNITVEKENGAFGKGWGETPLSVQWVWPSDISYGERLDALLAFSEKLLRAYSSFSEKGHALEIGHSFISKQVPEILNQFNLESRNGREPMPWLAALVCASPFDLALHDAYGVVNEVPIYQSYNSNFLNYDLDEFLESSRDSIVSFCKKVPADYLKLSPPNEIPVWHLVGGLDALNKEELNGEEPNDGYPVHLEEWIERDGLNCLKIKLRGNDSEWDYNRLLSVGEIAHAMDVEYLSTDFNCTVTYPDYVNQILDLLKLEHKQIWNKILYVEQPFPYDLETYQIKVHSLSQRKPLFMDESAHDWKHVRLGLELGWSGVALKTCKTQTGALLSLCWAKAHGMDLMVQDLTNPMLAQIPHVLLGAHAGTIMGVESNSMQFYPDASFREALIHPGVYQRRKGVLDLSTIDGPGFGYKMEIQ